MIYDKELPGHQVVLRPVEEEDAGFILNMRLDTNKNAFIHYVDNDISKEIKWIRDQRERKGDYFFSILRRGDRSLVGTVAICDVNLENGISELGRWVSYGTAVENLESVILAHDFAFDVLGLKAVFTKTLQENIKVVNFWRRFGGEGENNKNMGEYIVYYNIVNKHEYKAKIRNKFIGLLEGK